MTGEERLDVVDEVHRPIRVGVLDDNVNRLLLTVELYRDLRLAFGHRSHETIGTDTGHAVRHDAVFRFPCLIGRLVVCVQRDDELPALPQASQLNARWRNVEPGALRIRRTRKANEAGCQDPGRTAVHGQKPLAGWREPTRKEGI